MALLEGESKKDLKTDESMPYLATITHGITVDDHVVREFGTKKHQLFKNYNVIFAFPNTTFRSMSFQWSSKI